MTRPLGRIFQLLLLVAWLGGSALAQSEQKPSADLLWTHGHIYTSNPARPWVKALAIRGDKIISVGSDGEVAKSRGARAAFAEFEEQRKGSLAPGKLADVTVLSQDLFAIPPLKISQTTVVLTVVGL